MNQQTPIDREEAFAREYSRLVSRLILPYFLKGGEYDDLYQEGMIGLLKAIRSYDSSRSDNFEAFATLCIKRRLYDALRSDVKLSRGSVVTKSGLDTIDFSNTDDILSDPEAMCLSNESAKEIQTDLNGLLSSFEASVLGPYLEGFTVKEISQAMSRPQKSVDNAIVRIKRKLRKYLEEGDNRA